MRNFHLSLIVLSFPVIFSACNTNKQKSQNLDLKKIQVSYYGQNVPGVDPVIFAPGIVSIEGRNEYGISFSPDFDELYYSASKNDSLPNIFFSKLENDKWTIPIKINFTKGLKEAEMHPFVSFDRNKIFFTAHNADYTDTKIWYVNRIDKSWSKAIKMTSRLNDDEVFYLNQSENEDFYYTNISKFKIYTASNKGEKLNEIHDTEIEFGIHGFISPSQDYLLLNARNKENTERKDNDIYVCFKEKSGKWTKPINLGNKINSEFDETCPSLTPDGNYLFFSRYNEENELSNFYWVSSETIENLRPTELDK